MFGRVFEAVRPHLKFLAVIGPLGIVAAVLAKLPAVSTGGFEAVVRAPETAIAHKEAGTVTQVLVRTGDTVKPGQALVVLSSERLDSMAALARAEVAAAEAKLVHARGLIGRERDALLAEREVEHGRATTAAAEIRSRLETAKGRRVALKQDVRDLKRAVAAGRITRTELRRVSLEQRALEKQIQALSGLLKTAESEKKRTLRRVKDTGVEALGNDDDVVAFEKAALDVARRQLAHVEQQRQALTLRATFHGLVTDVHVGQGSTVPATSPLVTLVEPAAARVVVCVPESYTGPLTQFQKVTLHPKNGGADMAAWVEQVPAFFSPLPAACLAPGQAKLGLMGRVLSLAIEDSEKSATALSVLGQRYLALLATEPGEARRSDVRTSGIPLVLPWTGAVSDGCLATLNLWRSQTLFAPRAGSSHQAWCIQTH